MTITIEYSKAKFFIGRCQYGEQGPLKSAGFRWSPADKFWWTDRAEIADKLRTHLSEPAALAVTATLSARAEAIDQSRAAAAQPDIAVPCPDGMAYLPYQLAGIAYATRRQNTLIADEMGLGKTIQAIGAWNADTAAKSALVVCPASLKINWAREWQKWDTRSATVGIANGSIPATDIVIVNYDILHKHSAALRAREWDLLISDECHYAKNPKAARTKSLLGAWDKDPEKRIAPIPARRRIFLTGTPILNRPIEVWPILHAIAPAGIGKNWRHFVTRYCAGVQGRHGWDVSGSSNLTELQDELRATCMVRRLKSQVLTELPAKRRQIITLPADGCAKIIGAEIEAQVALDDRMASLRVAVELAKTQDDAAYDAAVTALHDAGMAAFAEISKIRHATAMAKLPLVIQHVRDQLDAGGKIVLFAHHHDVIDALAAEFGACAVTLTGSDSQEHRQASVDRFQNDDACTLFLGSIGAAGVGITLTESAHVIFAELDWVPGRISQAEDRTHRIGQTRSVLIQHLVLDGSIDAKMAKTLVEKQAVIDAALDDRERNEIASIPTAANDGPATERYSRKQIAEDAIPLTADDIAAVHEALRRLAARCDGAQAADGQGFNRYDAQIGKSLAAQHELTPRQAALGKKIIYKYRKQLS
jgi:SWI/SNF-related matrix-associated actin-dependent regulator 1 of chromatin subfamily A